MTLTPSQKREAAIQAPRGPGLLYPDTRIVSRPGWYQLITPSAPRGMLNEIAFSEVSADDAERVIDEAIATFRAAGQPVKWWVGPWTRPADFAERLERRGFERSDVRGMGCDTGAILAPAPGVQAMEIGRAQLDGFLEVQSRGWYGGGEPSEIDRRIHSDALTEIPRVVHLFAAQLDGALVGTSAVFIREDCGYLLGGQVLEAARGRGAYRAMVAARLAFLAARGIGYAVTQALASTSAPILTKLGFETLFKSRCYHLDP